MKINKHPIKSGSVIIFNINHQEIYKSGMKPKQLNAFSKSLVKDIKNALPVDCVIVTGINSVESIDIFESEI